MVRKKPGSQPAQGRSDETHPAVGPEPAATSNDKVERTPAETLESRRRLLPLEPEQNLADRRIAIILHAHLPWVLGHGRWPHGEEWLTEAILFSYLPLIKTARRFEKEGRKNLFTFSISPVLAVQLADPRTPSLVDDYFESRLELARTALKIHPLQRWWIERYELLRGIWEDLNKDLIGELGRLAQERVIELSTTAATHAYLPLAPSAWDVHQQLGTAIRTHRRLFGLEPQGCWLPECAYRPLGPWKNPLSNQIEEEREGLEEALEAHGIRWTVVDTHLASGGAPLLPYRSPQEPEVSNPRDLPFFPQPLRVGESNIWAMVREPVTARQVWSRQIGYPGDPRYLDFHKRHDPSGLRLWRVSHAQGDLGNKLPYWPSLAEEALGDHSLHFARLIESLPFGESGILTAPFDAELFGHWWFEGPRFLEHFLEVLVEGPVRTTTPSEILLENLDSTPHTLVEGSWGEGGRHDVWLTESTQLIWEALFALSPRVETALHSDGPAAWKAALLNQYLAASSSDWPFLISTDTAAAYAEERINQHLQRVRQLLNNPSDLPPWVDSDRLFLESDLF